MTVSHRGENGSPGRKNGLTTEGVGGLAEKEARPHGFMGSCLSLYTIYDHWSTLLVYTAGHSSSTGAHFPRTEQQQTSVS